MRVGGGGAKGAQFERETCTKISLWLSRGKRHDLVWRSAMSGGRSTILTRAGRSTPAHRGDLTAIDSAAAAFLDAFVVECKFNKTIELSSFILKRRGRMVYWWATLAVLAAQWKVEPLLVAKENFVPTVGLTTERGWRMLLKPHRKVHPGIHEIAARAVLINKGGSLVLFAFDEAIAVEGKDAEPE